MPLATAHLGCRSKRKYFEHTGGLLTADGSDDHLIKMEGVPDGETFSWDDDDDNVSIIDDDDVEAPAPTLAPAHTHTPTPSPTPMPTPSP